MRWQTLTSIAAALVLNLGCAGEMVVAQPGGGDQGEGEDGTDGDEPGGPAARDTFAALAPQLKAECFACHMGAALDDTAGGPDFFGLGPDIDYDMLLGYESYVAGGGRIVGNSPDNSKLYAYGKHAGEALSADLAEKVAAWIVQLAEESAGAPPDGPPADQPADGVRPASIEEALALFASCMTFADFQTSQFENVANQAVGGGGPCYSCHTTGTAGALLAEDDIEFYNGQRDRRYILKFVTGTVSDTGSFGDLVLAGRYVDKQGANGHPDYQMDAARVQAIQQFYDLTHAHYQQAIESNTPCTPDAPTGGGGTPPPP